MDTIIFQVSKELKEELEKEAKMQGLSLSGYIRMILINRKGK